MAKWSCVVLPALSALLLALSGCGEEQVGIPHDHQAEFEVTLCGKCGDVKENDQHACKTGAAICPKCRKHKGSVLCCTTAINGNRDVILCRKCGEKVFTNKCCQASIAACPKCGLHKDSPGCCKIERVVDDGSGHAAEAGKPGHT